MNLEEYDEARHGNERVGLPEKPNEGLARSVGSIASMGSFIASVMNAMQNWQDNLRLNQPGTRERVVTVRLRAGQGGLNLEMSPADIEELITLGREAGGKVCSKFDFEAHRWRRYLTWSGASEEAMNALREKFKGSADYESFVSNYRPREYAGTSDWRADTNLRTQDLIEMIQGWDEEGVRGFLDARAPRPKPAPLLRLTPDH